MIEPKIERLIFSKRFVWRGRKSMICYFCLAHSHSHSHTHTLRVSFTAAARWTHSKASIRYFFPLSLSFHTDSVHLFFPSLSPSYPLPPQFFLLLTLSLPQAMQFVGRIKMFDLTPQKIAFSGIVGEVVDWYLQAMFDNVVTRIDQVGRRWMFLRG